ncbi:hypothetical protein DPMN_007224 [Dreissena polymorpha]|uniref:Uncharacterized protein n=1 Tax=Dreissena polymorpha TaxID=45954 RepID=A0A9D4MW57_DREPO|nr:hypothetical protein DPMN_007224 [Dreissena polymorpha]
MLDKSESDIRKMQTCFKISQQYITDINAKSTSNKDAILQMLRGIPGFLELKVSQKYLDILHSSEHMVDTQIPTNTDTGNLPVLGASGGHTSEGFPVEVAPKRGSTNKSLSFRRRSIDTDKSWEESNITDVIEQIRIENRSLNKTNTECDEAVPNVTTHDADDADYDDDAFEEPEDRCDDQVSGRFRGHHISASNTSEINSDCNINHNDTNNARDMLVASANDHVQQYSKKSCKHESQIQVQKDKQENEEDMKTKLDNQSPFEHDSEVTQIAEQKIESQAVNQVTEKALDNKASYKSTQDSSEAPDMGINDISPVPTPMPVDWEVSIRPDGSFHLANCGDIKCFQAYFLAAFPRLVAKVDASSGKLLDKINLQNPGNMCKIKNTEHIAIVQLGIGISIIATKEERLRLIYTICTNASYNALCNTVTYEKYPDESLPDPSFHFLGVYSVHQGMARHEDFINAITPIRLRKTASAIPRQLKYEAECKPINLDSDQLHGVICLDAFGENVIVIGSNKEVICFKTENGSWREQWRKRFGRTVKHIVCSRTKKKVFVYTEACKVLHMLDKETAELSEFILPVDFTPDIIDIHKSTLAMTHFDLGCWKSVYIRQNLDI